MYKFQLSVGTSFSKRSSLALTENNSVETYDKRLHNCKSGVITRLCCNLAICDKITRFVAFFLIDVFLRLPFQSLKSNKINFSLGQHVVQKSAFGFVKALLGYLCKTGPFRTFYAKSYTLL